MSFDMRHGFGGLGLMADRANRLNAATTKGVAPLPRISPIHPVVSSHNKNVITTARHALDAQETLAFEATPGRNRG